MELSVTARQHVLRGSDLGREGGVYRDHFGRIARFVGFVHIGAAAARGRKRCCTGVTAERAATVGLHLVIVGGTSRQAAQAVRGSC